MYAFEDGYDQDLVLPCDLSAMIDRRLALTIFTDSESLFKFITSSFSFTLETRFMVYVRATKQNYDGTYGISAGFARRIIFLMGLLKWHDG